MLLSTGCLDLRALILALLIVPGLSLICYNCNSLEDSACINMDEGMEVPIQHCKAPRIDQRGGNWLIDIVKADRPLGRHPKMGCQKVVFSKEKKNGKLEYFVFRGCQYDSKPCTPVAREARLSDIKLEHCSLCYGRECNNSPGLPSPPTRLLLLAVGFLLGRNIQM